MIIYDNLMEKQEQANSKFPNVKFYDRMFRYKPYTKCFECQTQERLRCGKCMEQMIIEITEKQNQKKLIRLHKKSATSFCGNGVLTDKKMRRKLTKFQSQFLQDKENMRKIMITSKYNHWMDEKRSIRKNSELTSTISKNWPRKTRVHDYNLQKLGAKQPKFEKWEKKLIDRLLAKTKE